MMDKKTYFRFSREVKKIVKDCFLGIRDSYWGSLRDNPIDHPREDLFGAEGFCPITRNKFYCYSKKAAIAAQDQLLEICNMLPNEPIWEGTAGAIFYRDIVTNPSHANLAIEELTLADQFLHLLFAAGIGVPISFEEMEDSYKEEDCWYNVAIFADFEDRIHTNFHE